MSNMHCHQLYGLATDEAQAADEGEVGARPRKWWWKRW